MEELFESVVHVKLLVAMEERQTGIIRSEVNLDFAEGFNEHHILQDTRRRLAVDLR